MRDFWHLKLQYGRDVPFFYCRLSEDWTSYPVGLPAAVYMSLIPFRHISKADRHITTGCTRNKDCCHLFLFRWAQTQMLTLSWLQEPVRFKGEYLGHTKWFRQVRTMKNICLLIKGIQIYLKKISVPLEVPGTVEGSSMAFTSQTIEPTWHQPFVMKASGHFGPFSSWVGYGNHGRRNRSG